MIGSLEPAQVPKDTRRLKKYPALKKKRKHSTDHTMVYAYCGSKTIDQPTKMCPGLALCVQTHEKHLGCTLFCHLLLPRLSKVSVWVVSWAQEIQLSLVRLLCQSFAESLMALMALSTHVPSRIEVKTCIATAPNNAKHFPEYYSLMLGWWNLVPACHSNASYKQSLQHMYCNRAPFHKEQTWLQCTMQDCFPVPCKIAFHQALDQGGTKHCLSSCIGRHIMEHGKFLTHLFNSCVKFQTVQLTYVMT